MKPTIVIARPLTRPVVEYARQNFEVVIPEAPLSTAEAIAAVVRYQAEGLVIGASHRLNQAAIEALPAHLKVIANTGAGFDHIDVAAARSRRIVVTTTPDAVTDCTADLTWLLILAAARRANEHNAIMRHGWGRKLEFDELLGTRVSGKTLGILGMGRIGQAVARRARGFDMKVIYHSRKPLPGDAYGCTYYPDLEEMLAASQILSLHVPGSPATDGLINRRTLALLPPGAVIINTARGQLIDEEALIDALSSGHLAAAGLDTYHREPDFDRRLAALPNVFLLPHVGSATVETRNQIGLCALDNVVAVLSGRPALNPV